MNKIFLVLRENFAILSLSSFTPRVFRGIRSLVIKLPNTIKQIEQKKTDV